MTKKFEGHRNGNVSEQGSGHETYRACRAMGLLRNQLLLMTNMRQVYNKILHLSVFNTAYSKRETIYADT